MQIDGITHRSLIVIIAIILSLGNFLVLSDFKIYKAQIQPKFYVDDDYNSTTPGWGIDHFNSINDAINASLPGDRIIVYEGTYRERILIPHRLDIFGESRDTTIIDGSNGGDVVVINNQYVNISHFTIRNSGNGYSVILINSDNAVLTDNKITGGGNGITLNSSNGGLIYDNVIYGNNGSGIYATNSNNNKIIYNSITSNNCGIFLHRSSNNSIENSGIKSNTLNGIFLNETCDYNTIKNNNISNNANNGIFLNDHCSNNEIIDNQIYSNDGSGIRIENSSYNLIKNNSIGYNKEYGAMLVGSYNSIEGCYIFYNTWHGVFLFSDDHTTVYNNVLRRNLNGIYAINSTNNTIYTNEIESNSEYGVYLDYFTFDNLIYNNYFHDNAKNAIDKSLNYNAWNVTKASGTNKAGGSYICGNYWDDFDETSEGAIDTDNDGVSNNPYTIYSLNKDYGPLLDTIPPTIGIPTANPGTQILGKETEISVTVTDNLKLSIVNIVISDPSGKISNVSIIGNKNGDTYIYKEKFSAVGSYRYYIVARDSRNWVVSPTKTFIIDKGAPPTITDNTPSTASPSCSFTFNATIVDDADSASQITAYVIWQQGELSGNCSLVNVGGNYFIGTIELDKSLDNIVYSITAIDRWGNSKTTAEKTISVVDKEAPTIIVKKHNYSTVGNVKTYTIGVMVYDNHMVSKVEIEYWFKNSEHKLGEMDKVGSNYYEKVIQIDSSNDRVYCVINATDASGNQKNTTNPYANTNGPYQGIVGIKMIFNGSDSFDLDGDIVEYLWDFGDGTKGNGSIVEHTYLTNGNYTVTLTVKDNDGNTNTSTTYSIVTKATKKEVSIATKSIVENYYGIELKEKFYCYDTDGDDRPDTFVDPNNILKAVHQKFVSIDNCTLFLISVDDSIIPEFIWNSTTDEIINVTHVSEAKELETSIDISNNIITKVVLINKTSGWNFIEVLDPEISEDIGFIKDIISVSKNGVEIDKDKVFRKDNKTFFLDDPDEIYSLKYNLSLPTLKEVNFEPPPGSRIDRNSTTIMIKFNVPVIIYIAEFYMIDPFTWAQVGEVIDIKGMLKTNDDKSFIFTPPNNLDEGKYLLHMYVKEKKGSNVLEIDDVAYNYVPFAPEEMIVSPSFAINLIVAIVVALLVIVMILRYKKIGFESFIYIKGKKVFPFFKPVVFGPVNIDINDDRISKAEVYVNGKLFDTITKPPYVVTIDKPMFFKQKIEAKVYDNEGNSASTGEMVFFVFNPPHLFK